MTLNSENNLNDDITIIKNSQDELQVVGLINQNNSNEATNPLKIWEGSEYEWSTGGGIETWCNWLSDFPEQFEIRNVDITLSRNLWCIAYGNGKFISVSRYGDVMIYENGSWSQGTSFNGNNNVRNIQYINNQFLVAGKNGLLFSTTDGYTWTDYSSSTVTQNIAYNGLYYLRVTSNNIGTMYYSTDLRNWSMIENKTIPVNCVKSNYGEYNGKGYFVFAGEEGLSIAISSSNAQDIIPISLNNSHYYMDIAYNGNGVFLCVGNVKVGSSSIANETYIGYIDVTGESPVFSEILLTENGSIRMINSIKYYEGIYYLVGNAPNAWTAPNVSSTIGLLKESKFNEFLNAPSGTRLENYIDYIPISSDTWIDLSKDQYGNIIIINATSSQMHYGAGFIKSYYTYGMPRFYDIVYSYPYEETELRIISIETYFITESIINWMITLSDNNIFKYNEEGDIILSQSIGEIHPDWLCSIENVGIKKGDTLISKEYSIFNGTNGITNGSSGLVTAPSNSDANKFLNSDGTWQSITVDQTYNALSTNAQSGVAINTARFLENNNPNDNGLTILSTSTSATYTNSVVIGYSATGVRNSVSVGSYTLTNPNSISLGHYARASSTGSIQIGYGTGTANTFSVGFSEYDNYQLLDGTTGKIPNERIIMDNTPIENSMNTITSSAIYNIIGDIDSLIEEINNLNE